MMPKDLWAKIREWLRRNLRKDLLEIREELRELRWVVATLRKELRESLETRPQKPFRSHLAPPLHPIKQPEPPPGLAGITLFANAKYPISTEGGGTPVVRTESGVPVQENVSVSNFPPGHWFGRCDPVSAAIIASGGIRDPLPIRLVGGPVDGQDYCGPPAGRLPFNLTMIQVKEVGGDLLIEKAACYSWLYGPTEREKYEVFEWNDPSNRRTIFNFRRMATPEEVEAFNKGEGFDWEEGEDQDV